MSKNISSAFISLKRVDPKPIFHTLLVRGQFYFPRVCFKLIDIINSCSTYRSAPRFLLPKKGWITSISSYLLVRWFYTRFAQRIIASKSRRNNWISLISASFSLFISAFNLITTRNGNRLATFLFSGIQRICQHHAFYCRFSEERSFDMSIRKLFHSTVPC